MRLHFVRFFLVELITRVSKKRPKPTRGPTRSKKCPKNNKSCKKCPKLLKSSRKCTRRKPPSRWTVKRRASGIGTKRERNGVVLRAMVESVAKKLAEQTRNQGERKKVSALDVCNAISECLGVVAPFKRVARSFARVFPEDKPRRKKQQGKENEENSSPISQACWR